MLHSATLDVIDTITGWIEDWRERLPAEAGGTINIPASTPVKDAGRGGITCPGPFLFRARDHDARRPHQGAQPGRMKYSATGIVTRAAAFPITTIEATWPGPR